MNGHAAPASRYRAANRTILAAGPWCAPPRGAANAWDITCMAPMRAAVAGAGWRRAAPVGLR
ncbi:hypothetical protein AZ78_4128 [Lysobacter capsici AZ78]|uniref:Uncharacterized protein n=1 Tax=Lysobacter capsici AZ78 TaxID=1444315 RepID=A0A108UCH5_9GAMM|nr:hypothetical protein AZ78_4128 [Lysobacter capsici AZ78]